MDSVLMCSNSVLLELISLFLILVITILLIRYVLQFLREKRK